MFQQRHYIALAALIREVTEECEQQALPTVVRIDRLTAKLADLFAADNSRFSRERFIAAASLD